MEAPFEIPTDEIAAICRRYGVRRLSLFGSALRDDFGPASDVDVLVEFEPGIVVGLKFITLQDELGEALGRTVDLNTPGFLSRHFRQRVLDTAQAIYERSR
jgi:predicted nucleotidyltransferase